MDVFLSKNDVKRQKWAIFTIVHLAKSQILFDTGFFLEFLKSIYLQ